MTLLLLTSRDVQNSLSGQILDACAERRGSSQPLKGMEKESMQIGTNYVNSSNIQGVPPLISTSSVTGSLSHLNPEPDRVGDRRLEFTEPDSPSPATLQGWLAAF